MDSIKRSRCEPRSYNERRSYLSKKYKSDHNSHGNVKKKLLTNVLVFDNGSYTIKIGYSKENNPVSLPNHIMKAKSERKRCFIADQIEDCRDLSGLFYLMPHEHGYITKFDVQKTVWDYTFNKFPIDECPVVMTQPIFNFKPIQEYMDEIFFEEYDVKHLYRACATDLAYFEYIKTNCSGIDTPTIVIDSGYSFTHIVPYIDGKKYTNGIIRMDIGGKLLTNYLKDILSYRQLHVMEETYVINQVKEDTCFMSQDFKNDMYRAKNTNDIVKNYVLPDFHNIRRGYVQDSLNSTELSENCQILRLNNERISVPEVLMKPSLIPGMDQAGLAQNIAKCVSKCPEEFRKFLTCNIVCCGGNVLFSGFKDRVAAEARMFLPSHYNVNVYEPKDPINYAWNGGRSFARDSRFRSQCVSKQNYEEYGSGYTYEKFNHFTTCKEEVIEKTDTKSFSYLNHWKSEGADIFQKAQMTHDASEDGVEFILEGEGIEEYDGKYVTLEFEYENRGDESMEERLVKKKKIQRTDISSSIPSTITSIKSDVSTSSSAIEIIEEANLLNINTDLSQINKPIISKVYKPIFRSKLDSASALASTSASASDKKTQIITLNNAVNLNGSGIIVPSSKSVTISSSQLLNNAVILPQNIVGFKKIIQVIPFRSQMIRPNGSFIVTKKL